MESQTPPPTPPKDDQFLKYISSASQMLQEIGDGSGISQLRTIASLTQLIIERRHPSSAIIDHFPDYTNILENIYTVICAVIYACRFTNVNLPTTQLSSLGNMIETFQTIHSMFQIQPKENKLLRNNNVHSLITKCTDGIDQAKQDFPMKYSTTILTFPRMHYKVVKWHRKVMGVLLRRQLKRNDNSVWSLPDTLRPAKSREPELQQIVSSLLEASQGPCIAILGPTGSGKTSLALSAIHHSDIVDHFGSRRHFLQCTCTNTTGELMMIFAQSFGLESSQHKHSDAILNYLNMIAKPILVVLDGFKSIWDVIEKRTRVEDFVLLLCSTPCVSVLLTITDVNDTGPTVVRWTCPLLSPLQVQHKDSEATSTTQGSTVVETNSTPFQGTAMSRLSLRRLSLRIPSSSKLYKRLSPLSTESVVYSPRLIPLFPCSLYSLNPYRQYATSVKFKQGSRTAISFTKYWKSWYLVLSVPTYDQFSGSTCPGIAYLHLFKSSAPEAAEVDRLMIDDNNMIISYDRGDVTGDKHTIRVCGMDARDAYRKRENNSQEPMTLWWLEIQGQAEVQKWISMIRDSVREQWCLSPLTKNDGIDNLCESITCSPRSSFSSTSSAVQISGASNVSQELGRADDTLTQVYQRLFLVLKDRTKYKELLRSRGNKAQLLLDILQTLLDYPELDNKVRGELTHALMRLSKNSGLYPTCFVLHHVQLVGDTPLTGGHFGDIWKGILRKRTVCIKVVKIYKESDVEKLLEAFAVEALIWGQFSHINLLPFYGIYRMGDSYGKLCSISPWMENGNINEYLRANPRSNRLLLILDVLQGINYLHSHKTVHGDLKGANILIASNGRACVADFGLSEMVESEALRWTSLTSTAPRLGGTVRWQAPELILNSVKGGSSPSHRSQSSDMYAFGCVCYEIFTGQYPSFEFPEVSVIFKVATGECPSCPHKSSHIYTQWGLTDGIWRLMTECWDHIASRRPTAIQLHERLTAGKILSDVRPCNGWENLSPSRFRHSIHEYPSLSDLNSLLP